MKPSILDLLAKDSLSAQKFASTGGGEFASPCPECGGDDRFRCWPESGRWWCRGCGKKGDLPGYLMTFHQMRYPEACAELGIEPKQGETKLHDRPIAWEPKETAPPPAEWSEKASALISWAEGKLWNPVNREPLNYLMGRGLSEETIRAARLGWNPKALTRSRKPWGLPEKLNEQGKPLNLWLPKGWVIPVFDGERLCRIKIRRTDEDLQNDAKAKKYIHISGGEPRPMVLGGSAPAYVVVEAELCALLLHQEAGDLAGTIAMGSANIRPDKGTAQRIRGSHLIIALDFDTAGAKETWRFWMQNFSRASRWPVPGGKDPTDAYRAGIDLRSWAAGVLAQIGCLTLPRISEPTIEPGCFPEEYDESALERLAIMTVDGGMSDEEALMSLTGGKV